MGEVYRAEDTKLGREVAVKVLPQAFVADPDRLARFEREARVLASLSHPNIAQIYEVGEAENLHFLAMELAAGETLAHRIARGAIPLDEALPIALQIAEALEYAHERGIVHRDLKPANVMVDGQSRVKLLDFGLARALEPDPASVGGSQLTHSPTLTFQATQMGLLMGTAAYMSPEQAAGKPADRRADIWAFGVVLLEMLTGRQVFQGETVSHVLAGVLKDQPDWEDIPAIPAPLTRLLERCLRKDPRHRLQSIGDARLTLEEVMEGGPDPAVAPAEPTAPAPRRSLLLPWVVAGLSLFAAAGLLVRDLLVERSGTSESPLRFELALPEGMELARTHQHDLLAISPDGRLLTFMVQGEDGVRRLALRELDQMSARILSGSEGGSTPAFSPDGRWIAFFSGGRLLKVPITGGTPEVVSTISGDPRGLSWATDGYLYATPDTQTGIQRVRETGGAFEPVTELDEARNERTHRWPHTLDGSVVLFTSDTASSTEYYDDARIEAVRTATGERKVLVDQASRALYLEGGHLLFARGGAIYEISFDPESLETSGQPTVVLQGVATTVASGAAHLAISRRGDLLYLPGTSGRQRASMPVWVSRDGTQEESAIPVGDYDQLQLSPDGRRAALTLNQGGQMELWMADLERGTLSRLTFSGSVGDPVWTPDGEWIYYREQTGIVRQRSDGGGEPEIVWESTRPAFPSSFTPDGTGLVMERQRETGGAEIVLLDLRDPTTEPTVLSSGPQPHWMGQISPDGRWLAYASLDSGRPEVYVRALSGTGGKWQISTSTGFEPRWSPDGRELFYRDAMGDHYVVSVEPGDTFRAGPPTRLLGGMRTGDNAATYSVAPDGERFLTLGLALDRQIDRVNFVLDWAGEVERIVGRSR